MPEEFPDRRVRSFRELEERNPSFIQRNINAPLDNFVGVFRNRHNDSYASGLFELPLPEPIRPVLGSGEPDMLNRAYQFYEDTLRDAAFSLPHSAKWAVFIRPHNYNYLIEQIGQISEYEPTRTIDDWDTLEKARKLTDTNAQERIGCIFALGVSQSGHSIGVSNVGGSNGVNNGFLKAPISQGRADNQTIELIVKETNSSYTDFVLRPWSILTGHYGFHARPINQSIKADITIYEMDHTYSGERSMIRKVFNYYDCLPIDINQENLNYEPDKIIQRQIQFAFNNYSIQSGENYRRRREEIEVAESVGLEPIEVPHIIIPESNGK